MSSVTYTVVYGDTLGAIANHFGTSIAQLKRANQIANADLIYIGQVLLIPGKDQATNTTIRTIMSGVRLRSTPEFADNIKTYLGEGAIFYNATLDGDWWKVENGYIHASMVEAFFDQGGGNIPPNEITYRSQWDVDARNRNDDCGQTCVAMLAGSRGVYVKINDLPYASTPAGDSTANDLVRNFGYNKVNLAAHRVDLSSGQLEPLNSICLIWYGGIKRESVQDKHFVGWHWVVLLEKFADHVVVHDPDYWGERRNEGSRKQYSIEEWNAAFIPCGGNTRTCVVLN